MKYKYYFAYIKTYVIQLLSNEDMLFIYKRYEYESHFIIIWAVYVCHVILIYIFINRILLVMFLHSEIKNDLTHVFKK